MNSQIYDNLKFVFAKQSKKDKKLLGYTASLILTLFLLQISFAYFNEIKLNSNTIQFQILGMVTLAIWILLLLTLEVLGKERKLKDQK